ncbi:transposase [Scandinavium manionii]|uniref:transposase n=1 Tax=Scandinavium manionii TaxID=2926520 RepID=UPI0021658561|nr:transposase [Scandinavium manionii]
MSRGRPQPYSEFAISTILMLKRVFRLTLRDYDGQVGEAKAMIRALNKMTRAGIPESVRIA